MCPEPDQPTSCWPSGCHSSVLVLAPDPSYLVLSESLLWVAFCFLTIIFVGPAQAAIHLVWKARSLASSRFICKINLEGLFDLIDQKGHRIGPRKKNENKNNIINNKRKHDILSCSQFSLGTWLMNGSANHGARASSVMFVRLICHAGLEVMCCGVQWHLWDFPAPDTCNLSCSSFPKVIEGLTHPLRQFSYVIYSVTCKVLNSKN